MPMAVGSQQNQRITAHATDLLFMATSQPTTAAGVKRRSAEGLVGNGANPVVVCSIESKLVGSFYHLTAVILGGLGLLGLLRRRRG